MTTFVMEARENYDPTNAALLNNNTPLKQMSADPSNIATGFDAQRRVMTYLAMVVPGLVSVPDFTNTTGFTLYDGSTHVYAPSATISILNNFSPQVAQKNIDTDGVVFNETYNSAKTVPAGVGFTWLNQPSGGGLSSITITSSGGGGTGLTIVGILDAGGSGNFVYAHPTNWGSVPYTSNPTLTLSGGATLALSTYKTPSDGTYRWIGGDFNNSVYEPNGPGIIDPYTNNYNVCAESCELYQFRFADDFAQTLAPALYAAPGILNPASAPIPQPRGVDATWVYAIAGFEGNGPLKGWHLLLMPSNITATETAAAAKLFYVIWATNPFRTDAGVRLTFGTDGNVYLFSIYPGGSSVYSFRLTQYQPPSLGTFGSNLPGTMTDVTPWSSSTGPNSDGANYTVASASDRRSPALYTWHIPPFRLPGTGSAAWITKFLKEDNASPTDYTKTLISCTYITLSGTPTFDYHSGFVTGYMSATWTSVGSLPVTGFAVLDCRETNVWREQSDFIYDSSYGDYTKRWLVFQVHPIASSTVSASFQTVFAQYHFVTGAPPVLLQYYVGSGWDAAYTAYGTAISDANVVAASIMNGYGATAATAPNFAGIGYVYLDIGLIDDEAPSFVGWFSGLTNAASDVNAANFNYLFELNAAFTNRAAFNTSATTTGGITPPFLRLSVGGVVNTGTYTFGEIF